MIDVTEKTFDTILNSVQGDAVVDFHASWCAPCRMVSPVLQKIESESDLVILKVDIDENPDLARRYGVMSIPTMILFRADGSTKTIVGAKPKLQLEKELGLTT